MSAQRSLLRLTALGFFVAKSGNAPDECEDAFSLDISLGTFGIADGATDSAYSARWAKLLASTFVTKSPAIAAASLREDLEAWLKPLQSALNESVPWKSLPWFAEEKARTGAFSSLLGLTISHKPVAKTGDKTAKTTRGAKAGRLSLKAKWNALAVGDSCLFHLRDNVLQRSLPLARPEDFGHRPLLIASNPAFNKCIWPAVSVTSGECEPGDTFLLATDALSCWILTEAERGNKPWNELLRIQNQSAFAALIDSLRATGAIRNDDTTLLVVRCISQR